MKKKYLKIQTGEYHWEGNLVEYWQVCNINVILPVSDIMGYMPAKLEIGHYLKKKSDKSTRDYASLRLRSVQEILGFYVSFLLAVREYINFTPSDKKWLLNELEKRIIKVFKGEYDIMVKK